MRYLSVACAFKCELPWLREWLDYHLAVGVEHFFLLNNDDDPNAAATILRPYRDAGLVTYTARQGKYLQLEAFNWAVRESIKGSRWLAGIDADEFLLPRKSDDLRNALVGYEEASGVTINWNGKRDGHLFH